MTYSNSIHNVEPLEIGGVTNRLGIDFQDHVAAGFCLEMLSESKISAIWCESQDDITIIRTFNNVEHVEFAQCKSNRMDQLWSPSILCTRDGTKEGSSILEKSLQFDRVKEPSRFRMVTLRPVNDELNCLLEAAYDGMNMKVARDVDALKKEISKRLPKIQSANGRGSDFWVEETTWDVRHDSELIKAKNLLLLRKFTESQQEYLTTDQIDAIYERIAHLVWKAGLACPKTKKLEKQISKGYFEQKVREYVDNTKNPASHGIGLKLSEKMVDAMIPNSSIELAQSQRMSYRQRRLDTGYLDTKTVAKLEESARARLLTLKARMDSGLVLSGRTFHILCLTMLDEVAAENALDSQGVAFLQGYMYNLTDRCQFRFSEAITLFRSNT